MKNDNFSNKLFHNLLRISVLINTKYFFQTFKSNLALLEECKYIEFLRWELIFLTASIYILEVRIICEINVILFKIDSHLNFHVFLWDITKVSPSNDPRAIIIREFAQKALWEKLAWDIRHPIFLGHRIWHDSYHEILHWL